AVTRRIKVGTAVSKAESGDIPLPVHIVHPAAEILEMVIDLCCVGVGVWKQVAGIIIDGSRKRVIPECMVVPGGYIGLPPGSLSSRYVIPDLDDGGLVGGGRNPVVISRIGSRIILCYPAPCIERDGFVDI